MIVKNEEECIERCIKSVKDLVDEMIIVDTGSTDKTIEICRELGAKVYSYRWDHDFAKARNYSLSLASGDWILWLDADEEIHQETERKTLRELAKTEDYDLYSFELNNFYGEKVDYNCVIRILHPRLFRNGIGFRFINSIHETLNIEEILLKTNKEKRLGEAPVCIWHYGYLDKYVNDKGKSERNITLLLEALSRNEEDPWLYYHLASEYYRLKDFTKSFQHINRSIVLFVMNQMTPPSLLYKLKYSILLSIGSFEGAYPAIEKAISLYPDYVDLLFYKGIVLLKLGKVEESIETFNECLKIGDNQVKYLTQKGLGSFQAWYYKGLCYEEKKEIEKAIVCYEQALNLCPTHKEAAGALDRLK
ncbi:glycosyl transferase [Bacillus weihaiensis]|uniref:Glycosyl transferase n=2 Tax=Bacillus weihaiensis TaxID=1547283 RepID=A0A1L3MXW5_9BACI|nr:glycosyl transferase [Bacillus weihaiensis]